MRGVYVAQIDIATLAAAKTLLYGDVASSIAVEILSANVTNLDANTSEQLIIQIQRVTTKGSPTGTSVTPSKTEVSSATSGVTWLGNLTAEPTTYNASSIIDIQGANNLGGYYYDPLPECRQIIAPGVAFGLRLIDTPTSFRCVAQITYREIG